MTEKKTLTRREEAWLAHIDARQLKLDVDDIISTVKQGVSTDAEAPAPARFARKKRPALQFT